MKYACGCHGMASHIHDLIRVGAWKGNDYEFVWGRWEGSSSRIKLMITNKFTQLRA